MLCYKHIFYLFKTHGITKIYNVNNIDNFMIDYKMDNPRNKKSYNNKVNKQVFHSTYRSNNNNYYIDKSKQLERILVIYIFSFI